MLQDKLPELIRTSYNLKVLVAASYKAKQSLAAKGLTPAIFLDPFYRDRTQGIQQISFNFKQRQIKPLPDFITVDIDDYTLIRKQSKDPMEDIDEQLLSKKLYQMLSDQKIKYLRQVDKAVFSDRANIEKFINNQSFHWFERSNKMYYQALTMGQQNYRVNTSDQPIGLCFLIEVQKEKSVKQIFDKMKNEVDFILRRIFELNLDLISYLKTMVFILFDVSQQSTVQEALQYTAYFKQNTNIHPSLIFRLAINGEELSDSLQWNRFDRPILHFNYNTKGSDPVRIIGQDDFKKIQQIVTHHKESMRKYLENRLDQLARKYEDVNKTTKIIANFFRGNTPSDRTYTKQEMDMRELADKLFIVEDYKRAYEIYKNIINKMEKRNPNIQNNLSEMIQLCLAMSKFHNIKIKSDPFNEIQKYAEKIIKFYENKNKLRLKKYLIFLVYVFHSFKNFERNFIRSIFYTSVKLTFTQTSFMVNVVPTLIYEQFANMNLFYPTIDYRRYCYDLTRVASRYSQIKMYQYALRCFLVVESLYRDTFSNIEKYQFTQLSHLFLEAKNYRQSLKNLKSAWQVYACRMESQDLQKNESELTKVIENYNKMIREIQKLAPNELTELVYPNLKIPIIHSLNLQTKDEMLQFDEKSGIKWQQIGEAVLDNKDMMSAGLNQKEFRNMFRAFDYGVPEEKYLIYRFNGQNLSEVVVKKNSRNAYVGEPIKLSFYMRNPLRGDIQVENINIKMKQSLKNTLVNTESRTVCIKGFKSCQIQFQIIPKEPGFLQLQRIQWVFMKLLSQYGIKQPGEIKSSTKSCYFKLNINPAGGCLESKATFEDYYYEGECTKMKMSLKNIGQQNITKVYFAAGNEEMFGFKVKQLSICLKPNEQKQVSFDIFIPLVHDSIQSGQQKKICKILILYKTIDRFRVSRTINKFNIIRVAKIQNFVCERLSTHLHLLSFSLKKNNKEDVCSLEWMIIPGNFQIVKKEAADLASSTNYFFFIRKGNFSMAKFQFQNKSKDLTSYPEQFLKFSNTQEMLSIRFLWRKQLKAGHISKYNIPIMINEHGYLSTIFPISFKINYQKQVSHNFEKNPYLEIPISIKLKNVLYNDELKTTIYLVDNSENDASWEGTTEKKILLKMGSQSVIDIKYIVVRPGIYILSNEIKYNITNSKSQHINITHSQYEKIYLTVKEDKTLTNPKINFQDAFKQFEPALNKKNVYQKENDSLI